MKIAVLTSGGVDSAFALHSLKSEGHNVSAHYLKIWNPQYENEGTSCPWQEDVDSVKSICDLLNVPLVTHNLQIEYEFTVMAYMLEELKAGRTPNPDVYCNPYIKFGAFFDKISFKDYDAVASGHYVTKVNPLDNHIYWHYADPLKDQSFFLSKVKPDQLSKIIFPCSGYSKAWIRQYAKIHDLPQKDKKDSQGLCFIGKVNYTDFISKYISAKPGNIVDIYTNSTIGTHEGLHLYAIGQRHGLDLSNGPWYVSYKDIKTNTLYVVNRTQLYTTKTNLMYIDKVNFYFDDIAVYFKYKHPQTKLLEGELVRNPEDNDRAVRLKEEISHLSFSPGQVVAMYNKDYKLIGNCVIA